MTKLPVVLICDDDPTFHLAVKHALKGRYECRSASHTGEAVPVARNSRIDVLLLDIQMRSPDEGLRSIPLFREADPDLAIVMVSGMSDFNTVRESMRQGAADYVPKNFDPDELLHTLERVMERRALLQRREQQNFEAVHEQNRHVMVGSSPPMQSLRRTLEKIRQSPANVIILGDTGTGKELVARQLRRALPDGSLEPFVAVDSATIQRSTAESTLFGHEKGAFTGAERTTKGIFEEADGGIVYFDEIGNMPLEIQAKLLRVLQEKEICRLGSSKAIPLDFRVICATNRDLEEMARSGEFKQDLLQRLSVLPIALPPLRERKGDIPELLAHFLAAQGGAGLEISSEAMELLQAYPWPGNVRELANVVAYLAVMVESREIAAADLPAKMLRASSAPAVAAGGDGGSFYEQVRAFERELLSSSYREAKGNVSRLAQALRMDRSHLYTKLKEYGIHPTT